MKKFHFIGTALAALILLTSACSPQTTPAAAPPTDTVVPTVAASSSSVAAAGAPANVMLAKDDKLGSFLVDARGMTLYLFTKDTPNITTCYDKCASAWPPLLTTGTPVSGEGVDASRLGTTARTDGTIQVTYNGWPLYYFAKDAKPGDMTGQNVGSVWFVVSPAGDKIEAAASSSAGGSVSTNAAASAGPATVAVSTSATLGTFLVDSKSMTLYLYTRDTPNTSTCYTKCATTWPPLLTTGVPVAGTGADASKLGTTKRTDGTVQVTYNGWPLYYFVKDTKPGDTTGQNVGTVWFVLSPAGDQINK